MDSLTKITFAVLGILVAFIIGSIFVALPVMLLWNWLIPVIFGLPSISFWQALGLSLLSSLLFKSSSSSSSN